MKILHSIQIVVVLETWGTVTLKIYLANFKLLCRDNLSDLKAQIAANQKGITLLNKLVDEHGLDTVHSYMKFIQKAAELSVRNMLLKRAKEIGTHVFESVDYMDDGSPIHLKVSVNSEDGSATFDFANTGPEVYG
jgi:5-oxoprolinase (ATP-hydrolysing)